MQSYNNIKLKLPRIATKVAEKKNIAEEQRKEDLLKLQLVEHRSFRQDCAPKIEVLPETWLHRELWRQEFAQKRNFGFRANSCLSKKLDSEIHIALPV